MDGNERFVANGTSLPYSVLDFWRWAYSNLSMNTVRGVLAEYIVASSFGNVSDLAHRTDWEAYDLLSPSGVRIEVKASAYVQSWEQDHPSHITFNIAPRRSWSPRDGYSADAKRHSDVYVFCVFTGMKADCSPLQLDLWHFFVLPTKTLDTERASQKTLTLSSLHSLNPIETPYSGLYASIEKAAGTI